MGEKIHPEESCTVICDWILGRRHSRECLERIKRESNEEFAQWVVLVRAYKEARLSFEKDRLIALSGLAKRIREKLGLTYAWGMWVEHLPRALMWETEAVGCRTQRWRASTLSWASIDIDESKVTYSNSVY